MVVERRVGTIGRQTCSKGQGEENEMSRRADILFVECRSCACTEKQRRCGAS